MSLWCLKLCEAQFSLQVGKHLGFFGVLDKKLRNEVTETEGCKNVLKELRKEQDKNTRKQAKVELTKE